MKLALFIHIMLLSTSIQLNAEEICTDSKRRISLLENKIRQLAHSKDVSTEIDQLNLLKGNCPLNSSPLDQFIHFDDSRWRLMGLKAELDKSKKDIEHLSKYRAVSKELEVYKSYALKLGVSPKEIAKILQKYREYGEASTQREQNSCQTKIDLRNKVLGDVRDLDTIGWCYAFSTADLLSYKLGQKISAADFAINYNNDFINNFFKKYNNKGEQDFKGGYTTMINGVLQKMKQKGGACLESKFSSEDNGGGALRANLTLLDDLKRQQWSPKTLRCQGVFEKVFPQLPIKDVIDIAERSTRSEFIQMLSEKACQPRINLGALEIINSPLTASTKDLYDTIDQQLESKNIVKISYNAGLLFNTHYTGRNRPHNSVVLGRRFNQKNGECEYLIRNSYGRGCKAYDTTLAANCEEGNVWMPKSILAKGVEDVSYLK